MPCTDKPSDSIGIYSGDVVPCVCYGVVCDCDVHAYAAADAACRRTGARRCHSDRMGPATTVTTTAAAKRVPRRTTDKRYECERPTVERIRKFFRKNYTGTDGEDSSGTETAHRKKKRPDQWK